jgi:hypothetical protein
VIVYHVAYAVLWTTFFIGATDTFFENFYRVGCYYYSQDRERVGKGFNFCLILLFFIPAVVEWYNVLIYFFR